MATKAERKAARKAAAQASPVAPTAGPAESAPASTAPVQAAKPSIRKTVAGTLKVKMEGVQLRGARAAWYEVLKEHDGKPAQDYLEATAKKPPSLPASGRAENPTGWLGWFVRQGIATVQVEAKPKG